MALLENKVIKVIKDSETTTIQVYSSPSDIKQTDGYTIFPVVLNDGTTVYAQAVQSSIETAGKTPLYYYPKDGVISYQLMKNKAAVALWAVVIFPGEGQTIHCYTPSEEEFNAGRGEDHTSSFLLEDGGTYDAKVVVDNPDLYLPGDLTITEGGDKIQKTINVIIGKQPSDGTSLTISPSTFNISYDTRTEAIPSAEFDLSTLENISSNSTNINITLSSEDGSEFEGDLKVLSDGISPSSTTCTFGGRNIPVTLSSEVNSSGGKWSGSYPFVAKSMIEGYSTLSFDCSNIKKKIAEKLLHVKIIPTFINDYYKSQGWNTNLISGTVDSFDVSVTENGQVDINNTLSDTVKFCYNKISHYGFPDYPGSIGSHPSSSAEQVTLKLESAEYTKPIEITHFAAYSDKYYAAYNYDAQTMTYGPPVYLEYGNISDAGDNNIIFELKLKDYSNSIYFINYMTMINYQNDNIISSNLREFFQSRYDFAIYHTGVPSYDEYFPMIPAGTNDTRTSISLTENAWDSARDKFFDAYYFTPLSYEDIERILPNDDKNLSGWALKLIVSTEADPSNTDAYTFVKYFKLSDELKTGDISLVFDSKGKITSMDTDYNETELEFSDGTVLPTEIIFFQLVSCFEISDHGSRSDLVTATLQKKK